MAFPCDGDQLILPLFKGEPWDGMAPRALTKVASGLYLRPEPPGHEVFFDPEQLEFWPADRAAKREGPPEYQGAPLLKPLRSACGPGLSLNRR